MSQEGLVIIFGFVVLVDLLWRREGVARPKPEERLGGLFAGLFALLIKFFQAIHMRIAPQAPFGFCEMA